MDELEILKIAHETDPSFTARTYYADILKFAKAIAAAEREACAKVCADLKAEAETAARVHVGLHSKEFAEAYQYAEDAIRMRSNCEITGGR